MPTGREVVTVKKQIKAVGRRVAERVAPTMTASISDVRHLRTQVERANQRAATAEERTQALQQRVKKLEDDGRGAAERQIRDLRDRVATLEAEVQEARRLNRYVAEVTDVVQEVLLPAADRDDDRVKKFLTQYAKGF